MENFRYFYLPKGWSARRGLVRMSNVVILKRLASFYFEDYCWFEEDAACVSLDFVVSAFTDPD